MLIKCVFYFGTINTNIILLMPWQKRFMTQIIKLDFNNLGK